GQGAALGAEHVGRPERMRKARKLGRLVQKLDANQATALRQLELGQAAPMIERDVRRCLRCVRPRLERFRVGADGEYEARTEGVGGAQQIDEIDGLGDALDADGEITARGRKGRFHAPIFATGSTGSKERVSNQWNVLSPRFWIFWPTLGP